MIVGTVSAALVLLVGAAVARQVRRSKNRGSYEVNEAAYADQIVINSFPELNGECGDGSSPFTYPSWDDSGKGMIVSVVAAQDRPYSPTTGPSPGIAWASQSRNGDPLPL